MTTALVFVAKLTLLLVVMLGFIVFVTLAGNNRYAVKPDWFSGDKNSCGTNCETLVGYTNRGFPIQMNGSATRGRFWLANLINFAVAVVAAAIIGWLLLKKVKVGLAICVLLLLFYGGDLLG